jgi:transposase
MPRRRPALDDSKAAALRAAGALHPHPERITDELFAQSPFFDRRDRVQVKYEMLRAHDVDGRQISKVARAFGTSRQAIYAAATAFRAQGIPGLLPQPRGPKRAHKCTDEILDFAAQWRAVEPESVTDAIRRRFGVSIHPRSMQRALARRAKKGRQKGAGRA